MSQLGQQELMEAGPRRRIIVPEGHGAWWGVDPGSTRVAVGGCAIGHAGVVHRWARTAPFEARDGLARLSGIYSVTKHHVTSMAACCPFPGVVWIEQPGGEHRNYPLFYAVGVIAAAVDDGFFEVTGRRPKLETVVPAQWKKLACGRGNIYKPKKRDPEPYGVLTWAREHGYDGTSWDEADVYGIAEAARREVELVQR